MPIFFNPKMNKHIKRIKKKQIFNIHDKNFKIFIKILISQFTKMKE